MRSKRAVRAGLWVLAGLFLVFGAGREQAQSAAPASGPGSALTIPQGDLIQPEALVALLQGKASDKPLVLQVGSHVLFSQAHIRGSEYAGPGSQAAGLQLLRDRVAGLSKGKPIVLYCGCCPWNRCPNMAPAFHLLGDLGFTHVKALYLANNLGTDWVDKGYPVERGQ
jgi:thiosulfate/3-mercaptopyruvate sulfurtransferase